jgi:hypothetical protein
MFTPDITLAALHTMHAKYGERIYGRYGFTDAFNPNTGWVNDDVIGINVGIILLSAENLRTGNVWRWFMRNREIERALALVGLHRKTGRKRAGASPPSLPERLPGLDGSSYVISQVGKRGPAPLF